MAKQTIDTYKLTSLEEPSDEILSQLMREVAEEAKRKGEEANRRFFENMMAQAKVEIQEWNRRYSLWVKWKIISPFRTFTDAQRLAVYERQHGICAICGNHFEIGEMEADHITPWVEGGKTKEDNCQMLCRECNRRKGKK